MDTQLTEVTFPEQGTDGNKRIPSRKHELGSSTLCN
jgi:hypothetical protein